MPEASARSPGARRIAAGARSASLVRRVAHLARDRVQHRRGRSSSRCSGATAPARRRRCARSWASCRGAPARSLYRGAELIGMPSNRIARLGIAYCPEERGIFSSLDVEENLMLPPVVRPGGMSVEEIYEIFPNLRERRRSQGTKLSGGEQQMLAIGRILRTGAKLLLLDEPTEGLAPVIVQQIGRVIETLKEKGFTILLVEQNFHFASTDRRPALHRRGRPGRRDDPQHGTGAEPGQDPRVSRCLENGESKGETDAVRRFRGAAAAARARRGRRSRRIRSRSAC